MLRRAGWRFQLGGLFSRHFYPSNRHSYPSNRRSYTSNRRSGESRNLPTLMNSGASRSDGPIPKLPKTRRYLVHGIFA